MNPFPGREDSLILVTVRHTTELNLPHCTVATHRLRAAFREATVTCTRVMGGLRLEHEVSPGCEQSQTEKLAFNIINREQESDPGEITIVVLR